MLLVSAAWFAAKINTPDFFVSTPSPRCPRRLHDMTQLTPASPDTAPVPYREAIQRAFEFTVNEKFQPDAPQNFLRIAPEVPKAIADDVARGLYDQLGKYRGQNRDVAFTLGGDCGNVHYLIANYIQSEHKGLAANFTMGSVSIDGKGGFDFTAQKFQKWRKEGAGNLYDCHSWITFGDGSILDATIATYVNTRRQGVNRLGGILVGEPGHFHCVPIVGEPHLDIPSSTQFAYQPLVLGVAAFLEVAPRLPTQS